MKDSDKWRYGIVLDAGSSGTRSYVYRWPRNDVARQEGEPTASRLPAITTKDKWTKKVHVGLSTYGETPQLVGHDHLKPLIDDALTHVPAGLVADTPVFLLATAGMRLLPELQRRQVLDAVCAYLQHDTRLLIPDCSLHIQVIPGATEGLYGWIAANYLLGGFDSPREHDHGKGHHTYGFLDMGGASAQIAFAPNTTEAAKHADNLTLLRLRSVGGDVQEHRVFVTTWLGFGVNEARKQYVSSLVDAYPSNTLEYPDPCLPSGVRASLDSKSLLSSPRPEKPYLLGTGQFDACLRATLPLLKLHQPCNDDPCLFGQHVPLIDFDVNHFVGVSQYWHTTHEIFEMGFGEHPFDLGTYQARVHDFCSLAWADIQAAVDDKKYGKHVDEQGAASVCFKASWLISILHDGLGIETDVRKIKASAKNGTSDLLKGAQDKAFLNPFTAVDTIKDTEVSWTLGKILLYASSTVPPSLSGSKEPVGFGSNTGKAVPDDWVYPSLDTAHPPPPPSSEHPPYAPASGGITENLPFIKSDTRHRLPGFIIFVLILIVIVFSIRHRIAANFFGVGPGCFTHSKPASSGLLSRIPILGRFLAGHRSSSPTSSYHRLRNAEAGFGDGGDGGGDHDDGEGPSSFVPPPHPSDFELGDWDDTDSISHHSETSSLRRARGKKGGGSSGASSPRAQRPGPYPLVSAAIDRAGVAVLTGSRESLGLGLGLSGLPTATTSLDDGRQTVRSKSNSRAATPAPRK